MYELVRSFLLWSGIALFAVFYATTGIVTTALAMPFDRKRRIAHLFPNWWARSATWLSWRAEVDDRKLPKGRHFVIVTNHQSLADIITCLHLRHNFKFLAKDSVFKVPFLGWYMYFAGYIPLKRGRKGSIQRAMKMSREWLAKGVSVLFYPEGTRSPDGSVREFKPGAFRLAIEAGVDVLPVLVTGSSDLLPKNTFFFSHKTTPMRLVVGDPIPVAGLDLDDVPALAERARQVIIAMKAEYEDTAAPAATALRATG